MLSRLLIPIILIGAGYWYWTGPHQERLHPDYNAVVEQRTQAMRDCLRSEAHKQGTTGSGLGPEKAKDKCADKFNVYEEGDNWHPYDMARP